MINSVNRPAQSFWGWTASHTVFVVRACYGAINKQCGRISDVFLEVFSLLSSLRQDLTQPTWMLCHTYAIPRVVSIIPMLAKPVARLVLPLMFTISRGQMISWTTQAIFSVVLFADQLLGPFPGGISKRLLIDGGSLAWTCWASVQIIQDGGRYSISSWQSRANQSTIQMIAKISWGLLCAAAGSSFLKSCIVTSRQLVRGLSIYRALDTDQQYYVLKYHAIQYLSQEKNCRAVIIDCHDPDDLVGKGTDACAEELYRHSLVRSYRAEKPEQIPEIMSRAAQDIGSLDVAVFSGHADSFLMAVGKTLTWEGSCSQVKEIESFLNPNATVIYLGCNTASGSESLMERVSLQLIGRTIIGFDDYLNDWFISINQHGKKIEIQSWVGFLLRDIFAMGTLVFLRPIKN